MIIFNSEKLIELRKQKKVSKYRMALDIGFDQHDISRLEKGLTKNPSFETVEALAIYFKVNMETFKKEIK